MCVLFRRTQKGQGGLLNSWCGLLDEYLRRSWRMKMLWQMWLLTVFLQMTSAEIYWTYVPDLPILHPTVWERQKIIVMVKDPWFLAQPATRRLRMQQARSFNYPRSGGRQPTYFVKDGQKLGSIETDVQVLDGREKVLLRWRRSDRFILNWSGNRQGGTKEDPQTEAENWAKGLSAGLWWANSGCQQKYIWKHAAAMSNITNHGSGYNRTEGLNNCIKMSSQTNLPVCLLKSLVMPCVNSPYMLLIGSINVTIDPHVFNVNCENCTITNRISVTSNGTQVMNFY